MINHIGKVAEYLVLAELIRRDVEAYPAISFRQEHYDVTVVRQDSTIARVQVKATELQNASKNNSVGNLNKNYEYLVLVVFDNGAPQFFILSKDEVVHACDKRGSLYTSKRENNRYVVREHIVTHKDNWEKIVGSAPA